VQKYSIRIYALLKMYDVIEYSRGIQNGANFEYRIVFFGEIFVNHHFISHQSLFFMI
jgi:hypothetical protein